MGSLGGGDLGLDGSILGATGLGELTLDASLLGLKIIPLEGSRGNGATTNTKSFTMRTRAGTSRLYAFLFIFGTASIGQQYDDSGAVDFVSKTLSFATFYFLARRHSETIPLEKGQRGIG
jgi:hypothetical protein